MAAMSEKPGSEMYFNISSGLQEGAVMLTMPKVVACAA